MGPAVNISLFRKEEENNLKIRLYLLMYILLDKHDPIFDISISDKDRCIIV